MLFNSGIFIFVFLPLVYLGFFAIGRASHRVAAGWLAAASLVFYGWWNPRCLWLLLVSIAGNYLFGHWIAAHRSGRTKWRLVVAIASNLGLLFYYKYVAFFATNLAAIVGADWRVVPPGLPLGISFFTFTQIAYLVDVDRGIAREANPLHYLLFVTYFPHLIAGPILHHGQMMPQFADRRTYAPRYTNLVAGLMLFAIGLAKKVVLADGVQPYVAPVFDSAANASLTWVEAAAGALAYTMQLYFDFSGYSDMARGLSRLFGIEIPINFDSPYKASSIAEFWRRWHVTLSVFLRDYLYIPLGGGRVGYLRRSLNLFVTMLLGGIWHGAGWTFVVWGALHGAFLVVNHTWRSLNVVSAAVRGSALYVLASRSLTFMCVVLGWIFFRAPSLASAWNVVVALCGAHEVGDLLHASAAFAGREQLVWLVSLSIFAGLAPNSQTMVEGLFGRLGAVETLAARSQASYRRELVFGATLTCVLLLAAINSAKRVSEFIYFNF